MSWIRPGTTCSWYPASAIRLFERLGEPQFAQGRAGAGGYEEYISIAQHAHQLTYRDLPHYVHPPWAAIVSARVFGLPRCGRRRATRRLSVH